jgi:hypothetical protein
LGEAREFLQSLSKGEKEEILADIKAATQTIYQ